MYRLLVVDLLLDPPRVDHKDDIIDRERGLRDVGGQHNLPPHRGLAEDEPLVRRRAVRVQREDRVLPRLPTEKSGDMFRVGAFP